MICRICQSDKLELLDLETFLFPGQSNAPEFHIYDNYVCPGCGVVSGQAEPTHEALAKHYNSSYRVSRDAIKIGDQTIDTPIDFTVGGRSLARIRNFHSIVSDNSINAENLPPQSADLVIDFGAYQGMFLHGIRKLWGCRGLATDYNVNGIEYAKNYLGFKNSKVTQDIYNDTYIEKAQFATMIHSLEHLREPVRFLNHLHDNILCKGGYLYIEVPNLYGMALCDPTHFFTYSADSLTYLLEKNGFEVLETRTSGYPIIHEFTANNPEQNLICLARSRINDFAVTQKLTDIDVDKIRLRLKTSYSRHSRLAIVRQLKIAITESTKFVYYFIFAGMLECISIKFAKCVAKIIGRR